MDIYNNPHYKPSAKQLKEKRRKEVTEMIEFGTPDLHSNDFPVHQLERKKNRKHRPL